MRLHYSITLLFIFLNFGCKKDKSHLEPNKAKRIVLVYMEANNNLKPEAMMSINGMESGVAAIDGMLLVFIKSEDNVSYLLKIKADSNPYTIKSDTIKIYNNSEPSSASLMSTVIKDVQLNYPSDSYGLVLWSHATAWAPPSVPRLKSFGYDRGVEMDIFDLKNAIPDNLDFIIFDACSMASIEVLMELKDKAKYIIASPSETIADSYPYQLITRELFKDLGQLDRVAKCYFDYYNSKVGLKRSATISLIKTSELGQLAQKFKSIIQVEKKIGDVLTSANVQRLDYSDTFPVPTYDFEDLILKNFTDSPERKNVLEQLNKTILFHAHTPLFLDKPINISSGITSSIVPENNSYFNYYKKLLWYNTSGLNLMMGD